MIKIPDYSDSIETSKQATCNYSGFNGSNNNKYHKSSFNPQILEEKNIEINSRPDTDVKSDTYERLSRKLIKFTENRNQKMLEKIMSHSSQEHYSPKMLPICKDHSSLSDSR